jgi:hypothetical protein
MAAWLNEYLQKHGNEKSLGAKQPRLQNPFEVFSGLPELFGPTRAV